MKRSELIVLAKVASSGQDKDENGSYFKDGLVKYEVIVRHNVRSLRGALPLDRHPVILQSDFIRKYHNFRPGMMALLFLTTQGSIGGKKVLMNCANSGSIMPASPDLDVKKLRGLSEKEQILFILKDYVEFKQSELKKLAAELPLPDIGSNKRVKIGKINDEKGGLQKNVNLAEMSEDIDIMSLIIDKTLKEKLKGEYYSSLLFGGRGCHGVYLENYGALFLMNVKFPVAESQPQPPEEANNFGLWERTEQEVRNPSVSNQLRFQYSQNTVMLSDPYDAKLVNELKEKLIRLIADYGANISQLQRQDVITLVVFGATAPVVNPQVELQVIVMNNDVRTKPNSTLIVKISKVDLDAHKAGKIYFKDFLKRAEVVQY